MPRLHLTPKQKKIAIITMIVAAVAGTALALFTDLGYSHCFQKPK